MPDEFSEEAASDLRNYEDQPSTTEAVTPPPQLPAHKCTAIDPDLAKLAFSFGQYLNSLPGAKAYASEACRSPISTFVNRCCCFPADLRIKFCFELMHLPLMC